jgi:translation initiation factor 1 (eIF-1/SUI1)
MNKRIPISVAKQPLRSPFSELGSEGLASPLSSAIQRKQRIVLRREKSRRRGKTVVIVSQLPTHLSPPEIETISRDARKALGCGGFVRGREIEIQGDQADRVRCYFEELGYKVAGP